MASELSILTRFHPSDWEIRKIKYVFDERRETNDPVKTDILISLTHDRGVIPHSEKGDIGNKEKDDLTKYKLVYPGDIVVNSMNVIIGSAGLSNYYGLVSPVYYMLTAKDPKADKRFFHYLFRSVLFQKSLVGVGSGILEHRMRISMDKLGSHFIPVPPSDEQRLISRYLDKKTQQIDTLIEKIEKKIELLKEQRTSLINHYVIKGLDPNVDMKDSGVEWIGKIPKHWDFLPLKILLEPGENSIRTGPFGSELRSTDFVDNSGYRVYNQRTVYDNNYKSGDLFITEEKFRKLRGFQVYSGDLLITTRGTIGRVSEVPQGIENGVIHPCLIRFRIDEDRVYKPFLTIYINESSHFLTHVIYESNSTTIEVIYSDTLKNVRFPVPSVDEQKRIVDHIRNKSSGLDLLITKERSRVKLLAEYRQSLISSVVTGKVRVTEDMV